MTKQDTNYLLQTEIPDFFENVHVRMSNSSDLSLYSEIDRVYHGAIKPVLISTSAGTPNMFSARSAGDLVKALALSLWHGRRSETEDIFPALYSIDPEMAQVVKDNYLQAKRKQMEYYSRIRERNI